MAEGMDLFISARLASDLSARTTTDAAVTFKALLASTIVTQAALGLRKASISVVGAAPSVVRYSHNLLNQLGYNSSLANNQLVVTW
jgi:hypothetical protein